MPPPYSKRWTQSSSEAHRLSHCIRTHAVRRPSILKYQHGDLRMTRGKRIYVLDTNVLMHDPTALFRFEEHDVFLPMTVLEELDAAKKGTSEVSRNARQVSRFINELIEHGNGTAHRRRAWT